MNALDLATLLQEYDNYCWMEYDDDVEFERERNSLQGFARWLRETKSQTDK